MDSLACHLQAPAPGLLPQVRQVVELAALKKRSRT
jgi:hypothetical protein